MEQNSALPVAYIVEAYTPGAEAGMFQLSEMFEAHCGEGWIKWKNGVNLRVDRLRKIGELYGLPVYDDRVANPAEVKA